VLSTTNEARGVEVRLRRPHTKQNAFLQSRAKRIIIRAGRRGGKTVGIAIRAVRRFLEGRRVLYAAPTQDQVETFWWEVKRALGAAVDSGGLYKNESLHLIELRGSKQRIRAKTAWNADTLRGDYADDLILDEWQLMDEQAWELVGAPMLLDNDGDAVFIYTPPSLQSRSISKARDPRHAPKLFKKAERDKTGRWAAFHFSSHDNPHISPAALEELTEDMTSLGYKQEILAEDVEQAEGALWTLGQIDLHRVSTAPAMKRIVVAIDPSTTSKASSDEAGIVGMGLGMDGHGYLLADRTLRASPLGWANQAVSLYHELEADRIVAEVNNGGEMVELTVRVADATVPYKAVTASRGKIIRAEPVAAISERGKIHHVGMFPDLEDELVTWQPGMASPNRLDAYVWAATALGLVKHRRRQPRIWFPGMDEQEAQR
jgi:hypothetical protein